MQISREAASLMSAYKHIFGRIAKAVEFRCKGFHDDCPSHTYAVPPCSSATYTGVITVETAGDPTHLFVPVQWHHLQAKQGRAQEDDTTSPSVRGQGDLRPACLVHSDYSQGLCVSPSTKSENYRRTSVTNSDFHYRYTRRQVYCPSNSQCIPISLLRHIFRRDKMAVCCCLCFNTSGWISVRRNHT